MELVMVSDLCFRPFSCAPLPACASALLRPPVVAVSARPRGRHRLLPVADGASPPHALPVAASSHYCALLRLPVVAASARPRERHLPLPVADGASPQPALPVVASSHCRALLRRPVADGAFPPPVRPVVAVSARPRGRHRLLPAGCVCVRRYPAVASDRKSVV